MFWCTCSHVTPVGCVPLRPISVRAGLGHKELTQALTYRVYVLLFDGCVIFCSICIEPLLYIKNYCLFIIYVVTYFLLLAHTRFHAGAQAGLTCF